MGANQFFGGLFWGKPFHRLGCSSLALQKYDWVIGWLSKPRKNSIVRFAPLGSDSTKTKLMNVLWPFALGSVCDIFHRAKYSIHPVSPKNPFPCKTVSGEVWGHFVVFHSPLTLAQSACCKRTKLKGLQLESFHLHYNFILLWGSIEKLWLLHSSTLQDLCEGVLSYSLQVPSWQSLKRLTFGLGMFVSAVFCLTQCHSHPFPTLQRQYIPCTMGCIASGDQVETTASAIPWCSARRQRY